MKLILFYTKRTSYEVKACTQDEGRGNPAFFYAKERESMRNNANLCKTRRSNAI